MFVLCEIFEESGARHFGGREMAARRRVPFQIALLDYNIYRRKN